MEKEMLEQLKEEVTSCGTSFGEVGRLRLVGAVSRIAGQFLLIFTIVLFVFAFLSFGAVAAINAMSAVMPVWGAALIMGGVYVVLIIIAIACRKPLFIHPFIKLMNKETATEEELALKTMEAEHKAEIQYIRLESRVENATRELSLYANLVSRVWAWLKGKKG